MDGTTGALVAQGLQITIVGMSLVFTALALLWALIALLNRLVPATEPTEQSVSVGAATLEDTELTAERARVAAIAAAALMSSAVPLHLEAPVGPAFEHGRTAPIWVTANRGHTLQPWQPPRTLDE